LYRAAQVWRLILGGKEQKFTPGIVLTAKAIFDAQYMPMQRAMLMPI